MDLNKTLGNISLYNVKQYVRKAQNAVLNLSEMEAKVREATNNEPWGTSSSRMAEIARGTFNYRDRQEICGMIFKRYTEKSDHEWRQIYKALTLEEYLIKHGSESFVDDATANIELVKMLRSFHYIDMKGVDQGINIRNRAKELSNLLSDESRIRQERKKAKENAKKFGGVSSNSYTGGSSRYGNYSSNNGSYDEDEGYGNRVFGDGGVFGERYEEQRPAGNTKFEEYEVETPSSNRRTSKPSVGTSNVNATSKSSQSAPVVDLFSFDNPEPTAASSNGHTAAADDDDDDDFDDFQTANTVSQSNNATSNSGNLSDILSSAYSQPAQSQIIHQQQQQQQQPRQQQQQFQSFSNQQSVAAKPAPKEDLFSSLLSSAKSKPMNSNKPSTPNPAPKSTTSNTDDLFGGFSSPSQTQQKPQQSGSSGVVDLLDL
ncbi:unnamed protein product [[Candida] boidinii]|uniref:Unnamed protein product n=1 Tax=Candida boidinii TaxID=5477 RepID=A0A9W6T282_CANBO|nr:hypothetical protein B5S30_g3299 [[Candida] boidinii]OWB84195.1 hypothetical protein B5S33_g2837 [[Candida] boidinii]GME72434.1 unnamed protein product [[Candida] boidinii]GMF53155.1 unnamed protein product [[Candida] boidinii]GMF99514.1 unnamed protein product [[Candida] boidinii]